MALPSPARLSVQGEPAPLAGETFSAYVDDVATWTKPANSREKVKQAGQALIAAETPVTARDQAREVVNNWRSAHGFPLNSVQVVLRGKVRRLTSSEVLVAQRTKRMTSIAGKLRRYPDMSMPRMHDVAGCRAVLDSLADVVTIAKSYQDPETRSRHKIARVDDYIYDKPKVDGYRGIHVVVNFQGEGDSEVYTGMRVEVQLRTKLMHTWATAVETVDTFTGQALKSSFGEADWQRFFALMGAETAFLEGTPLTPGTPASATERRREIQQLARDLEVVYRLGAFGGTLRVLEKNFAEDRNRHYLLDLNRPARTLSVTTYSSAALAETAYGNLEALNDKSRDIVLVAVNSVDALRRAYPNYFLDTSAFVELVQDVIAPFEDE